MANSVGIPQGQSGIVVRTKIFPVALPLLLTKPNVSVDGGLPTKVPWGEYSLPLPPGRHSVRCFVAYLWYRRMGDATIEVDVPAGGVVELQWRSPALVILPGKWKIVSPR